MGKLIVKYFTKPTDEIVDYLVEKKRYGDIFECDKKLREFLSNDDNFGFIIYNANKFCGTIMFNVDEKKHEITMVDVVLDQGDFVTPIITNMQNKYIGYRLVFKIDNKNKSLLPAIKKFRASNIPGTQTYLISL